MTAIEPWLRDILRCPCPAHATLLDATDAEGRPELHCTSCDRAFRVEDGIPILLLDEARSRT